MVLTQGNSRPNEIFGLLSRSEALNIVLETNSMKLDFFSRIYVPLGCHAPEPGAADNFRILVRASLGQGQSKGGRPLLPNIQFPRFPVPGNANDKLTTEGYQHLVVCCQRIHGERCRGKYFELGRAPFTEENPATNCGTD